MRRILAAFSFVLASLPAFAQDAPQFRPEPFWPKPLPENWILGQVAGIATDKNDNIWIIHRPATLLDDEKGAMANPPQTKCCKAAPAVMKFDADGNLLASWGGPNAGHPWIKNEHGIHADAAGNIWIGGNNDGDQIFQFSPDGKLLQQIGKDDGSKGSNSTTRLGRPAHMFTDDAANEIYVADGYGNRRVVVFDMKTGAYKRHWGAYGTKTPTDDKLPAYSANAEPSKSFGNPVHCVRLSNDGLVYVCDRTNNRIQVFKKDGTFVTEWFYDKSTLGAGAVWDLNFWPDANQTWLFNIDGENNLLRILRRSDGKVVGSFGRSGRNAGNFHWVHSIAVDSKGNIYTGEVDNGKRVQKFKPNAAP